MSEVAWTGRTNPAVDGGVSGSSIQAAHVQCPVSTGLAKQEWTLPVGWDLTIPTRTVKWNTVMQYETQVLHVSQKCYFSYVWEWELGAQNRMREENLLAKCEL